MHRQDDLDLTKIARDFPRLPEDYIKRENYLDTIVEIFESGVDLITVEGKDGIGKTTLLTEFATKYSDRTLSLFIRPINPLTYEPNYLLLDLCNQLHWLLFKKDIDDFEKINPSLIGKYVFELERLARANRHLYYLVIDGLDDIPNKSPALYERIIGILPPSSHLHFLTAVDPINLPLQKWKNIKHQSYRMSRFTLDDTRAYLSSIINDDKSISELHHTCKGIPGHLSSAKRSLLNGISLDTLLSTMPEKQPDLFAIEWQQVNTEMKKQALAIITYGRKEYTLESISSLLDCDRELLLDDLQGLSFLHIDTETDRVSFLSETFRSFAEVQLNSLKEGIMELIIQRLSADPESDDALVNLTDFLQDTGKLERLLEYLSPSIFANMLERTHSLSIIKRKAEQGIVAADKLNQNGDLVRFCTQKSTLIELDEAEIWSSEIDARMAVQDYDSALALAQSAIDNTHRLKLLALIAKEEVRQGIEVSSELVEQIRLLCEMVDATELGDEAIDIACNLLCISVDLAIKLVEASAGTNAPTGKLDWAFAKLSIFATSTNREQPSFTEVGETIRSKIKDPVAQRLTSAAACLFGEYSAEDIIQIANEVEGEERLFILRQWAKENPFHEHAGQVVEYAVNLALRTTDYTPKARDLREIATPLPHIKDCKRVQCIIEDFNNLDSSLKHNGPTQEYVRLQLLLATAENTYDHNAAIYRLLAVYCDIAEYVDISAKCECLALLRLSLMELDTNKELEAYHNLHTLVENDFTTGFDMLLHYSADHYKTIRNIVSIMDPVF